MQITEMIALMRAMGIGEDVNVESYNDFSLNYLNLAHDELYAHVAEVNQDLIEVDEITTTADVNNFNLINKPFFIHECLVFGIEYPLSQVSYKKYLRATKTRITPIVSTPKMFAMKNQTVFFYPQEKNKTYDFSVVYVPHGTSLDTNTLEDDIPYPRQFHRILVYGAIYYLLLDEGGLRVPEREKNALEKWNRGKSELLNYLINTQNDTEGTYSNV